MGLLRISIPQGQVSEIPLFKGPGPRQRYIMILDCAITMRGNFLIQFKTKKVEFYAMSKNVRKLVTYSGFSFVEITENLFSLDNI